ncbi:phosphoribosylformylglycinamidine cyclo-ligase [Weissella uvarum]|uniref:phosphoribosylformylglycinamidine cyclo-ligase n=1 Tax=Weissella uvarum TaxID=1479233 RepID=UPI00195FECE3|nr:phosphoribosylformylglycinamidine cyclo-ligase [Weissella uvarum]MBM7617493.1 phosphoribosylformylglycinamidine cyclo-ligase [Weissella uvarum]MCM0595623.1 phosphoribosylformylglycinamidine cyclo-ligase [Weissella uvarum]
MKPENAYAAAGVDVHSGKQSVEQMQAAVNATFNAQVLTPLGSFGSAFALPTGFQSPVLISGTDGVGTKLLLTIAAQKYDTIGQDLVAMVMNDVLAQGAQPLFMLDYLAVDKMRPKTVATIVSSIAEASQKIGAALIGGESAELPGMYAKNHYDLAGFGLGVVEKDAMLSATQAQAGDILIGLPSSGLHANGYSLVRKLFNLNEPDAFNQLDEKLQTTLLTPTRLYHPIVGPLLKKGWIHSIAHITGGGIVENLPRAYGSDLTAHLEWGSWPIQNIFDQVQSAGNLSLEDMLLTFNNGLGMILIVTPEAVTPLLQTLAASQQVAYKIGELQPATSTDERIQWKGQAPWP